MPAASLGKLINVPELPAHFLPRPKDLAPVKALILTEGQEPVAVGGVSHRVVLHGMGGIGKSVLAAALVRTNDIRGAFSDGVIWLTLGQHPAIIERQVQLAKILSNSPVSFTDEQQGKSHLSELLHDAACLIILDDVWQMAHVRAFDALGPKCCLLITTRDLELIAALGAREHRLDVLSENQALESVRSSLRETA